MAREVLEAHPPSNKIERTKVTIKMTFFLITDYFEGKCKIFPAIGYDFKKKNVSLLS